MTTGGGKSSRRRRIISTRATFNTKVMLVNQEGGSVVRGHGIVQAQKKSQTGFFKSKIITKKHLEILTTSECIKC